MPGHGLSYHGKGIDPTYGPVQLNFQIGSASYIGKVDTVNISCGDCTEPREPIRRRSLS